MHTRIRGRSPNLENGVNRLEFLVRREATRTQVKTAFEDLFQAKVEKANTFARKDGKHAIIKLKPGFSAEEIGMRIGVFCWGGISAPRGAAAASGRPTRTRVTPITVWSASRISSARATARAV